MGVVVIGDWISTLDKHSGAVTATATVVLVLVTTVYVVITHSLLSAQRQERKDRLQADREAQAQLVGAHIDWTGGTYGPARLTLTVHNASPLPIRAVTGRAYNFETKALVYEFGTQPVVIPETSGDGRPYWQHASVPEGQPPLILHLSFDDDAGRTWVKYEDPEKPLRRVK